MQEKFPLIEFFPSTLIFEEHALADSAYILKEGRVEISMQRGNEKVVIAELAPVSIFGEMALLSKEKRRTATARALGPVKAIRIDKDNFDQQLSDTPSIITAVLHGVTQRLIDTTSKLTPGYIERREKNIPPPPEIADRRALNAKPNYDRIKIQLVRSEQKISTQPLESYREVRQITVTNTEGVRVDYFDGEIDWFPINTLVYVLG